MLWFTTNPRVGIFTSALMGTFASALTAARRGACRRRDAGGVGAPLQRGSDHGRGWRRCSGRRGVLVTAREGAASSGGDDTAMRHEAMASERRKVRESMAVLVPAVSGPAWTVGETWAGRRYVEDTAGTVAVTLLTLTPENAVEVREAASRRGLFWPGSSPDSGRARARRSGPKRCSPAAARRRLPTRTSTTSGARGSARAAAPLVRRSATTSSAGPNITSRSSSWGRARP